MFDDAAAAWSADTAAGHRSLIVVDTASDAADVSTRCQHHLMVAGRLGDHVADAADGCRIHIGDLIQTRRNTVRSQPVTASASSTATCGPSPASPATEHSTSPATAGARQPCCLPATSSPPTSCSGTPPPSPVPRAAPWTEATSSSHHELNRPGIGDCSSP